MSTGSEKMDGGGPVRPGGSVLQRDRSIGLGLILVVAVALVVTVSAPPAAAPPSSGPQAAASGSPGGGGSTAPGDGTTLGPAPTPTIPPTAWEPLEVEPGETNGIAALEPTKSGPGGLALDTAFRLTSLDGREAATLAASLVAEPAIDFLVESVDGATAIVRPKAPLQPRTGYRIALARPDGTTEATWAALAAGPLVVTSTVPEDASTGVPRDTGIEFTFDQFGVKASDVARYFTIKPAVDGTFHVGGRAVAFAPDRPLAKGRLYTVTLRHGLPLAGTGQVLADDVVLRFETRSTVPGVTVRFRHPIADGNPREATAVALDVEVERDGAKRPSSIPVTIHRLAGLAKALDAYEAVRDAPSWTIVSPDPPVPAAGLTRVFRGDLKVRKGQEGLRWIQLPRLPVGWYLVTERHAGTPNQLVLQVTDVASFALVSEGTSAFWVNDLARGTPIAGATLAIDGTRLGRTDERGVLEAPVQALDEDPGRSILVVRAGGRGMFVPFATVWCEWQCGDPAEGWWHVVTTDRSEYRTTDTINAWGVVHARDNDSVPASITLSLRPSVDEDWGEEESDTTPIITVTTTPDVNGAFIASVPITDLPSDSYVLTSSADGLVVGRNWLEVGALVKPAYRLAIATDHRAVIAGSPIEATAEAAFFEDTPVAGTELRLWTSSEEGEGEPSVATARTDAGGHATARLTAGSPYENEQWTTNEVIARPTLPEEGDIGGSATVMVFRGSAIVDADASLEGTRLTVTGLVSEVALDRYEVPGVDLWAVEPRGDARAGVALKVKVVQETSTRRQTGTRYDFILKRVVPVYDYGTRRETVLTDTVTTGPDGRYRLATTVKGGEHSYDITVTYTDEAGRAILASAWASRSSSWREDEQGTWLENAATGDTWGEHSVGDTLRVRLRGGGGDVDGSRYLFAVAQRGLQYVTVGDSPTFRTTFKREYVPGVSIVGVRFNGSGYEQVIDGYRAAFRADDRSLAVTLTPDRDRYAPGDSATVAVETRDVSGKPVAATVVVRAIDEKLFAMGAAEGTDTRAALYEGIGDGITAWASSHRTPFDDIGWGKGDTTGGGGDEGRNEFRDWLVAELVHTGADGRGTVTVPLSDDLTSWRVIGSGVDAALEAGDASAMLPVGLPFFVEATIATSYLVSARPVIRVRAFGADLEADETVTFSVRSDTLRMRTTDVTAPAFTAAEVALPPLSVGEHKVRVEASVGSGASRRTDTLTRTFSVVATRTTQAATAWESLEGPLDVRQGDGMTRIVLADAGRGRVVPVLESLRSTEGPRADDLLAARVAGQVLRDQFGLADTSVLDLSLLDPYRRGGIALLPYSSVELDVTALAAMTGDRQLAADVYDYLWRVRHDGSERRDRRLLALAGLAGADATVLPEVRAAAARTDLRVAERISVALAAVNLGDEALARRLLTELLDSSGRRYGNLVRIEAGDSEDPTVQTARLAIVAASLGDPVAIDMDRWVTENSSTSTSTSLEQALAARGWAMRVPGEPAVAALTVDGDRTELRIESGDLASVSLTPAQARTASLEPVTGSVLAVQTWESALDPASLSAPAGLKIQRRVTPAETIASDDVVIVTLAVTVPSTLAREGWRVVDLLPSGLVPVWMVSSCRDDECEEDWDQSDATASPDRVEGQRVEFTVEHDTRTPTHVLRYAARVVTPGTYTWEPAVIQSTLVPTSGIVLPATAVTIESPLD